MGKGNKHISRQEQVKRPKLRMLHLYQVEDRVARTWNPRDDSMTCEQENGAGDEVRWGGVGWGEPQRQRWKTNSYKREGNMSNQQLRYSSSGRRTREHICVNSDKKGGLFCNENYIKEKKIEKKTTEESLQLGENIQ